LAIARGELEAARAMGMNRGLMFRRIIAPQVMRYAIPGLGNLWQVALKDSSLISVTGLVELMRVSQVAAGSTREPFVFYVAGGILYLALTSVSDRVFEFAEARATRGMKRPGN
jgi:octopine/nopaline transport system permease protein